MPPRTAQSDIGTRVRRGLSVALSATAIIVSATVLVVYFIRPSTFLSDGTWGLPPFVGFVVDAQQWMLFAVMAAVILAGSERPLPGAGEAQRRRRRLPMVLAIVAACLLAACWVLPGAVAALSLLYGLVFVR